MSNAQLSVMLVDHSADRAEQTAQALLHQGYTICRLTSATELNYHINRFEPDAVIIMLPSSASDMLSQIEALYQQIPVIVFAGKSDNPAYVSQAIAAGVSAYIIDGFDRSRLTPVIQVALARFTAYQQLRQQLATTQNALNAQQLLDKAKRLLMKKQQMDEATAFTTLRKLAMDRRQKLSDVAKDIITLLQT